MQKLPGIMHKVGFSLGPWCRLCKNYSVDLAEIVCTIADHLGMVCANGLMCRNSLGNLPIVQNWLPSGQKLTLWRTLNTHQKKQQTQNENQYTFWVIVFQMSNLFLNLQKDCTSSINSRLFDNINLQNITSSFHGVTQVN